MTVTIPRILAGEDFQSLLDVVTEAGYQPIGPTEHDGAVAYAPVRDVEDFPVGLVDTADAGRYRLEPTDEPVLFGCVGAAQSWKRFLYPPREQMLTITTTNGSPVYASVVPAPPRWAFIGVRACDLAAVAIQDKVFLEGPHTDPRYATRRGDMLVIAAECVRAGGTCFCTSMGTGPAVTGGADLILTEVVADGRHWFLVRTGSLMGEELLGSLPTTDASETHVAECTSRVESAAASMGRTLETDDVHDLLLENPMHPRWQQIGARCLACTNCTMVCPTCFCSTTAEASTLDGTGFTRERRWDSCFTLDFSALHRHPVRSSVGSRYRQWLTHKLASWVDQFGVSGCVGCGRCITWCPVGIDITEEVAAIRDSLEVHP